MWEYQITEKGVVIGKPLRGYRGLTTGIPGLGPWIPGRMIPNRGQTGPLNYL